MRLAWSPFEIWLEECQQENISEVISFLDQVSCITENLCEQSFDTLLDNPILEELQKMWTDFIQHLRHRNGNMSSFWMSYMDMVENVMLGILRASREGK